METRQTDLAGIMVGTMVWAIGCQDKLSLRPGAGAVILNEDNSHFFARETEKMTVEGVRELVDRFNGSGLTHLFLCPNAMRVNYRSKVWTSIWEGNNPETTDNKWVHNAWILDQKGIDPYVVWIERCRQKGISPWISMRMNDIHNVLDMTNYMHSRFWKEHPEYWRVPGSRIEEKRDRAFDYGHPEVQEYHLLLIREYLDRYDMDGLELDWMRFGSHFRPGHEAEGARILTEFMREVRTLTRKWSRKRGHPIQVAARVPTTPEIARGLGMDGIAWAKEGLVDVLVLTPFFATDTDIPVERWRELLGSAAKNVVLAAGTEQRLRATPAAKPIFNDVETMRGFTAAMLHRGADAIYLFNHMDAGLDVIQAAQSVAMATGARRHVLTFTDTVPPGVAKPMLLFYKVRNGKTPGQFRIYTGPRPTAGKVMIRAGVVEDEGFQEAVFSAVMNSVPCEPLADAEDFSRICQSKCVIQFNVPLSAMQDGYNLAELFLENGKSQLIDWVEIDMIP